MPIDRITMFKIPKEEDVLAALEAFKKLEADNKKDGKPYMVGCSASKLHNDPRSQGYTLVARTSFHSLEDMKYYDEECDAHKALKGVVGPKVAGGPPLTVYMDA